MSSFYDDASLVVIPSGYKTSKIYAEKPTDGTGDLTFSRASDATRVASNGLIEKVRTNLYPRGSALLSTGWTSRSGATLTAGQTDPNGGTGALRVQLSAGTSFLYQGIGGTSTYNRSAYIKAATAQTIKLVEPYTGVFVLCNLTTSYQRFNISGIGAGGFFGIQFDNTNDSAAKDFTISFVQIEEGDIATDYIPTTTAAVSVGPVANVPRLDYLGSTCPRLLLEPQRTNLSTYSEDFNAAGGLTYATVSSNTAVSPDGYTNADSFLDTTDNNIHAQIRSISKAASPVTYTHSLFIKAKDAGMKFQVSMDDAAIGGGDSGIFDPSTGTFVTAMGTPSAGYTNPSRSVTSYGNGWYRVSFTITTASATTNRYNIFLINASNATVYAGTGTGVYLYGAQLEAGAYATSYIPTLGASVTRVADDAYKGGISSLIGQSEGTVFLDYIITDNDGYRFIQLYNNEKDASAISVISLHSNAAEILAVCYRGNGTFDSISLTASGYSIGQRMKVAFRYKSGDFALYVNGIQKDIDSGSLTFIGTKAEINLADPDVYFAYKGGVLYNQFLQFKTGLTNAQLAELTTL